ncbi:hypothetical protein GRF59_15085 [Paenibacillus sp. HJL G12]|uniref:Uncharacterized protein n=1 Tax=Paenibacillus dendrobii TaxID=2691084 RepID=A0A7X3LI65_9BACL|nr:hypothetical protein [Paenibacillus dendrobii]MWV44945.1 hypothetical protein [Paenibacillus dendrobii]
MNKLEAAVKKVERYESKILVQVETLKNLGADPLECWATFPAGSEERKAAVEIGILQRDLNRAKQDLLKRQNIEAKKENKNTSKAIEESAGLKKWMQSKTGTWHKIGFEIENNRYPSCQSYNLDRPNLLQGDPLDLPPDGAHVCKKCQSKNSGKLWTHIK